VRVLDNDGTQQRDLPRLSGVSKEAITAAVGFLKRQGYATVESTVVRLTDKGLKAQAEHERLSKKLVQRWRKEVDVDKLMKGHQLALGLQPYPDGWRAGRNPYRAQTQAILADPAGALPQYPMVLHRGGYPDGS
jgi:hypothetical protein